MAFTIKTTAGTAKEAVVIDANIGPHLHVRFAVIGGNFPSLRNFKPTVGLT